MAKLTRKLMKVFGSLAGANQLSQFGSLAAGAPAFTTDPETLQSFSNYLTGWFAAVTGGNSPAIEDMNALHYLFAYQLAYLMQTGVPEWNSATTYYTGSLVNDGTGNLYVSLQDANTNNSITSAPAWWRRASDGYQSTAVNPVSLTVPLTVIMSATDNGKTFNVNTAGGACQFALPSPAVVGSFIFTVKDIGVNASTQNITLVRFGSEKIEGVAATYVCAADGGSWTFTCDGTNWFLD